jgi:CheY-like chemotaxis protein
MLLKDLRPEDPIHEDMTEIVGAGERAAELTRQLLAFSRQQVLQPRTLDLNGTIAGLSKILARIIGEDIELVLKPKDHLGNVRADPGQVEQVLFNLAVNARDAMPQGGTLTLGTAEAEIDESYVAEHIGVSVGSYVVLVVTDTGTGMDRATQARIFEPFFTTKEKGKGTGLGLATVFGIVKQSGGSIWVYSELGRGTTFKVYLPRTQAAAISVFPPGPPACVDGTETVLLVEDDPSVRTLARTILKRRGYRVLEASGPGDALVISENYEGHIELLLTDVVMPVMGGRALAERLQAMRPTMRVVFMSGYTDDTVLRHGVVESKMAFVQKPLLPQLLLEKVRQVLGTTPAS